MSKRRFLFYIDILGVCNLSCPSCPTGNMPDAQKQKGLMEPELLGKILDKAIAECEVGGVGLFNWTEPLLHPRLPELIRAVQSRGLRCYLSSNLNIMKNIDAVLAENPYGLRLSLSGFSQETYGYSHRGGHIETVKKHMELLAEARKRLSAKTLIHVLFHRYKSNLEDEPRMRAYAESLGFQFEAVWAVMMPVEKVLAYADRAPAGIALSSEDRGVIDRLALPLSGALFASKKQGTASCTLQDDQMVLDHRGNVSLCCGVYEEKYKLGPYLDLKLDELQAKKYQQEICNDCMDCGVHTYITYGSPELDRIAADNIDPKHAKLLGLRGERFRKRLRHLAEPVLSLLRPYREKLSRT